MFTAIEHNDFETVAKLAPEHWNDRENGITPLSYACRLYSVPSLAILAPYGNVNEIDDNGYTPLKRMVMYNQLQEVKLLLAHGADPNINDILHRACVHNNIDIITLLLQNGARPEATMNTQNEVRVDFALQTENYPLSKILLEYGAQCQDPNSINRVIANSNLQIIELLLDHNYRFSSDHVCYAIKNHNKRITKLLLDQDSSFKQEALMCACRYNDIEILKLIMNYNVDINGINETGQSPIFEADDKNVLEWLISQGANINHKDFQGNTYLHYAVKNMDFNLTEILLSLGADPFSINNKGLDPQYAINSWLRECYDDSDSDAPYDSEYSELIDKFIELFRSYEVCEVKEVGYD